MDMGEEQEKRKVEEEEEELEEEEREEEEKVDYEMQQEEEMVDVCVSDDEEGKTKPKRLDKLLKMMECGRRRLSKERGRRWEGDEWNRRRCS